MLTLIATAARAADTLHVVTTRRVTVVTDPAKGIESALKPVEPTAAKAIVFAGAAKQPHPNGGPRLAHQVQWLRGARKDNRFLLAQASF